MKVDYMDLKELANFKRAMPKSEVTKEYEGYLRKLPEGQLGRIAVDKKDGLKANTVRNRLVRVSRNLGLELEIRRVGNEVIFYKRT